jgi:hypothetical protein
MRNSRNRVTECWTGISASVRLGTGELDHFGPLFDFVGGELAEVGRCPGKRRAARSAKPRLDLGIGGPALIRFDRSTLAFWVGVAAAELKPIYERLKRDFCSARPQRSAMA